MASSSSAAGGSSSKKIFILGSSGQVGQATLQALNHECDTKQCDISAGTRKPGKVQGVVSGAEDISVTHADMSDKGSLVPKLRGCDSVFLITPGDESRSAITCSAIDACKEAGVKFVLLMSITMVGSDTLYGKQFKPVEDHLKKSGLSYAIIRCPSFADNFVNFRDMIVRQNVVNAPVDPEKPFTLVAVKDIGSAAAHILVNCDKFKNQVFNLTMPSMTYNSLVQVFSKVLGKQITYKQVSYDEFKGQLSKMMPEYAAQGTAEIYRLIQSGQKEYINVVSDDIKKVTGHDASTFEQWLQEHKSEFASVGA